MSERKMNPTEKANNFDPREQQPTSEDQASLPQGSSTQNGMASASAISSFQHQQYHGDEYGPFATPVPSAQGLMAPPPRILEPQAPQKRKPGRPFKNRGETVLIGTVRFYVGTEKKQWDLSERDICNRVPFFNTAFQKEYRQGKEKIMRLPEEDPIAFAKLINWLNFGTVDCSYCGQRGGIEGDILQEFETMHELSWCKLWAMADKFDLDDLAKCAFEQLRMCLAFRRRASPETFVSKKAVDYVYKNAAAGSGLRKFMAMEVAYYSMSEVGYKDGDGKFTEYHCGNEEMKQDFTAAAWHHILTPHLCAGAHWRVPNGCCYPG